jgi:predicted KAP-like P-loop ATPase
VPLTQQLPGDLVSRLDTADRLAHVLATASQVRGNPRLIKRFLNELAIRMSISDAHGVGVDEAALVKMLLFERCATPQAYDALTASVSADDAGRPRILTEWEDAAVAGKKQELSTPWDDPFILEWLALSPRLADVDLRGILYVSREHAPLVMQQDRLSSGAAELLAGLIAHPEMAATLREKLAGITRQELAIIMDRLLDKARQVDDWGCPPILEACLVAGVIDPLQAQRLSGFLQERPPAQIRANIVPKIADQAWSKDVFAKWKSTATAPVKGAITQWENKNHGNVPVK